MVIYKNSYFKKIIIIICILCIPINSFSDDDEAYYLPRYSDVKHELKTYISTGSHRFRKEYDTSIRSLSLNFTIGSKFHYGKYSEDHPYWPGEKRVYCVVGTIYTDEYYYSTVMSLLEYGQYKESGNCYDCMCGISHLDDNEVDPVTLVDIVTHKNVYSNIFRVPRGDYVDSLSGYTMNELQENMYLVDFDEVFNFQKRNGEWDTANVKIAVSASQSRYQVVKYTNLTAPSGLHMSYLRNLYEDGEMMCECYYVGRFIALDKLVVVEVYDDIEDEEELEGPGPINYTGNNDCPDCDDMCDGATIENYKFKNLLNCFIDRLKTTELFTITESIMDDSMVGDSNYVMDAGLFGEQTLDLSFLSESLPVMKTVLVIISFWLAAKIVLRHPEAE